MGPSRQLLREDLACSLVQALMVYTQAYCRPYCSALVVLLRAKSAS